ncbi:MAG: OmpH family outer membrane protein [Bacteroidales bacterium]|nr:OmpH family outer membrane protein [Bacteroidales bacterium]MBR3489359.1 OmpH family outer membrane protein [Bacteroidales bacterium]MBR6991096.1 OmpH family outer membrane protein [Bacteroidales bacterium]
MRKYLFIALLLLVLAPVHAQKYACVNTDYIMRNVPEYNQALTKINKYIEEWQQELQNKQQEVDELRQQYQQEAYLLPDNLKQRRQDEIHNKETELRALQRQRFGTEGDLEQKRAELMKPVQDRVYNAIERVAREKNYAFVFDKSASATVIYVSEKYDISNLVLEMLGVKPGAASEGGGVSTPSGGTRQDKGSAADSGASHRNNNERKEVRR